MKVKDLKKLLDNASEVSRLNILGSDSCGYDTEIHGNDDEFSVYLIKNTTTGVYTLCSIGKPGKPYLEPCEFIVDVFNQGPSMQPPVE